MGADGTRSDGGHLGTSIRSCSDVPTASPIPHTIPNDWTSNDGRSTSIWFDGHVDSTIVGLYGTTRWAPASVQDNRAPQ